MVLRVVPVDVLVAKQREELAAKGLEVPDRRRLLFDRIRARGGEELHEALGVAGERHALGAQLAQDAEHRVGAHGGGEGLERVLALGVGGDDAQRGAHEALPERLGSRMISWAVCRAASARPAPDIPWKYAVVVSVSRTRSCRGVIPGAQLPSSGDLGPSQADALSRGRFGALGQGRADVEHRGRPLTAGGLSGLAGIDGAWSRSGPGPGSPVRSAVR